MRQELFWHAHLRLRLSHGAYVDGILRRWQIWTLSTCIPQEEMTQEDCALALHASAQPVAGRASEANLLLQVHFLQISKICSDAALQVLMTVVQK